MFNNNSMGDAGNGFALIKADFGEHGTGGDKKDFFPLSADNAWKDEGCQNSGRTSASTASGMGILCIIVKDQKPAVIVAGSPRRSNRIRCPTLPRSPVMMAS